MEGVSRVAKTRDTPTGGERTQHTPQEEAASTQHKTPSFSQRKWIQPLVKVHLNRRLVKTKNTLTSTKGSNLRPSLLKTQRSSTGNGTKSEKQNKTPQRNGLLR